MFILEAEYCSKLEFFGLRGVLYDIPYERPKNLKIKPSETHPERLPCFRFKNKCTF